MLDVLTPELNDHITQLNKQPKVNAYMQGNELVIQHDAAQPLVIDFPIKVAHLQVRSAGHVEIKSQINVKGSVEIIAKSVVAQQNIKALGDIDIKTEGACCFHANINAEMIIVGAENVSVLGNMCARESVELEAKETVFP